MITILRLKCLVLKGHQPSLGVVGEAAVQCLPHRRPGRRKNQLESTTSAARHMQRYAQDWLRALH